MARMGRRGNGEGSTYKVMRGGVEYFVFEVSYKVPDTNDIKRKQFSSKKSGAEARRKAEAFIQKITSGLLLDAESITFKAWVDIWLKQYKENSVRTATLDNQKALLKHAVAVFGDILLSRIKGVDIQKLLNELLINGNKNTGEGLKPSTVNVIRDILKECFFKAVDVGYLKKNIMSATNSFKSEKSNKRALTKDEISIILNSAKADKNLQLYMLIRLALETGFRRGEVFALHWEDIDFTKKTITLYRQLTVTSKGLHYSPLKTEKSKRVISLSDKIVSELRQYKTNQAWQLNIMSDKIENKGLLFINSLGAECRPNDYLKKFFTPLVRGLGINDISYHNLRHTHATMLLQEGENMKIMQERLGHSTMGQTADTYSHTTNVMQEGLVTRLNKISKSL